MPHKRVSTHKRLASRQGASDKAPDAKVMRGHLSDVPKSAMRILQAGKVREDFRSKMHLPGMRRSAEDLGPKAKREAMKQQKAEGGEYGKASASTSNLTLREGEKLGDFNRRVEMAMAPRLPSKSSRKRKKLAAERQAAIDAGGDPAAHVCKDPSRCLVHQQLAHKARLAGEENEDGQSKKEKRFANREPGKADLARARASLEKASAGKGGALARSNNVSDEEELDFAPRPQGRRLNDVAQAPPTLTRAPRGQGEAAKARKRKLAEALGASVPEVDAKNVRLPDPVVGKSRSGVNVRREEELEKERERAIKEYRRLKFGREARGM
ncbi:hypothetical protein CBOM_04597 [Ceraceosorus bombacis]|uniref:Uncharacterized protein n=1 Tax=Ceraceosorus bombacis TaxID=401625 RepID=A0A0P1BQ86_9BASI|nr:hypothetical protein CBOM_04597 [Ceraceosorus bombacis]